MRFCSPFFFFLQVPNAPACTLPVGRAHVERLSLSAAQDCCNRPLIPMSRPGFWGSFHNCIGQSLCSRALLVPLPSACCGEAAHACWHRRLLAGPPRRSTPILWLGLQNPEESGSCRWVAFDRSFPRASCARDHAHHHEEHRVCVLRLHHPASPCIAWWKGNTAHLELSSHLVPAPQSSSPRHTKAARPTEGVAHASLRMHVAGIYC